MRHLRTCLLAFQINFTSLQWFKFVPIATFQVYSKDPLFRNYENWIFTVDLKDRNVAKINYKLWPFKIGRQTSVTRSVVSKFDENKQNRVSNYFLSDRSMAIWKIIKFVFRSNPGRYNLFSSAKSSNIKIWTSSAHPGITKRALQLLR
jgi:hypothetical protein